MFRIKICGITNVDDARAAADAGADAIGINFFSKSSRFVALDTAQQIAAAVPPTVMKVGVFVNHSSVEIANIIACIHLDCIQLHGDESADILTQLPATIPVVRAWRPRSIESVTFPDYAPLVVHLELCRLSGRVPDALLIDAASANAYGGSGRLVDWKALAASRSSLSDLPLILAGGLTPENVARAIEVVRPTAVDVASGVEHAPGRKRASRVLEFVEAAREAFERL